MSKGTADSFDRVAASERIFLQHPSAGLASEDALGRVADILYELTSAAHTTSPEITIPRSTIEELARHLGQIVRDLEVIFRVAEELDIGPDPDDFINASNMLGEADGRIAEQRDEFQGTILALVGAVFLLLREDTIDDKTRSKIQTTAANALAILDDPGDPARTFATPFGDVQAPRFSS